jgi:diacylglycerol O-acyltransferase
MHVASVMVFDGEPPPYLVVTNVPGPQSPLYPAGPEALAPVPDGPPRPQPGLGIALMSYDGSINFGLVGGYDLLGDIEEPAEHVRQSLAELADAAGVELAAGVTPAPSYS